MLVTACAAETEQWVRAQGPVLRDPVLGEAYEVASDPHVFLDQDEQLQMIYVGDDAGVPAVKLAYKKGPGIIWAPAKTLIGPSTAQALPVNKETPFYIQTGSEHLIFFIGYNDEATYESEIYLAVSDSLEGPYAVLPEPVIPRGQLAGRFVHTITSPSIVEHEGRLHIVFLGWDHFEQVSAVWAFGGVSEDGGRTWIDIEEVDVPIGMEGQITAAPSGEFVAVRSAEHAGGEAIFYAKADHPFGPYQAQPAPILIQAGAPWELDEITAPQITFDPETGEPVLFYTGADHSKGWWVMTARPRPPDNVVDRPGQE